MKPCAAVSLVCLALAAGCDDTRPAADASFDAGGAADGGVRREGGATDDAATPIDASARDGGGLDAGPRDAGALDAGRLDAARDAGLPDAGVDAETDAGTDAGTPARSDHHIHIDVSNTCGMTVTPTSITVPAGQTAYFDWHNHSDWYPVDVWMSYGGGYTDLATHATWDEPVGHCIGPSPHTEHADISTACSSFRFPIHCL